MSENFNIRNINRQVGSTVKTWGSNRYNSGIAAPFNNVIDTSMDTIVTAIGSFIITKITDAIQTSITFKTGVRYSDQWMEEALYGILYQHNTIKKRGNLRLTNAGRFSDGSGLYYKLEDGIHNLKYRNYKIMLSIETNNGSSPTGRISESRTYIVSTYTKESEKFVNNFERDMIIYRNSLIKIKSDSPVVNVYRDGHEGDGYTYWMKGTAINKRRLNTVYLPIETKEKIVDTVNTFFASKERYKVHGIAWNLKILLYGKPGVGKDTITKMIASEWNRNLYYVTGGKSSRFIPEAISSDSDDVQHPLFLISDVDKYPYFINDTEVDLGESEGVNDKENRLEYKQAFGRMINALDGIMSGEGRIIIMTTNNIEKFSPVFLRPGRIDLLMEIGYVTPEVFRKYVKDFYQVILPENIKLKKNDLTVGTLQFDVLFRKLSAEEFIKQYVK